MESIDPGDPLSLGSFLFYANLLSSFSLGFLASVFTIALFLLASALVSGAEAAFFSLSEDHLQLLRQSDRRSERLVVTLLQAPRRLLATLLALNTIINLGIITVAAHAAWLLASPLSTLHLVVLTLAITLAIVFFGEVLPKVYAIPHNRALARSTARFFRTAQLILRPLSWLLLSLSRFIEGRFDNRTFYTSAEGLQQSIDIAINEESSVEEQVLLQGIVNFSSVSVTQVMRSRLDISALEDTTPLPEVIANIQGWGFSRIPVYHESIDKIEGILYIKDLLPYLDASPSFEWPKLVRPPYFVPESKKLNDLLRDFQELRVHMAIVVDEYGGTSGLVTLADIIEEIVGDLSDEVDEEEDVVYSQVDENTFIFEGKTLLHDFCRTIAVPTDAFDPVRGESESVGGLMLELFSRIPRAGEEVAYDRFKFVIESADNKKIKRVKVHLVHLEENVRKTG
ncbi:gliding motility-associated protein GldE [soil metagenome]